MPAINHLKSIFRSFKTDMKKNFDLDSCGVYAYQLCNQLYVRHSLLNKLINEHSKNE